MNVRIISITIENIKNIEYGKIVLENPNKLFKASVLGLYGQNGSGKTAVIDVIQLLRYVLCGNSVPDFFADYINVDAHQAALSYEFRLQNQNEDYNVTYSFILDSIYDDAAHNSDASSSPKKKVIIRNEILRCPLLSTHGTKSGILINTDSDDGFMPKTEMRFLTGEHNHIEILVAKKITALSSRSFIFSKELLSIIFSRENEAASMELSFYASILQSLVQFGNCNLFTVNTLNSGLISLHAQPLFFLQETEIKTLMLLSDDPMLIKHKDKQVAEKIINSINIVLSKIVPGLKIGLTVLGSQAMENGEAGDIIQLMSRNNRIPLKFESEGIKKIISILHLLIAVYNQPSITVAIDELDSGIFEYLLGEILRIISLKGKGQLVFTSHNLRPLETLDKGFVAFTTTNPKKRYVRMKNVKQNNNLRDFYYRDIMLGEQSDELYRETNNAEIAFAFREAGVF